MLNLLTYYVHLPNACMPVPASYNFDMSAAHEADRHWPYYVEVENFQEPTPEELERGARFAKGLSWMHEAILRIGAEDQEHETIDDQHLTIDWGSLNRARLIVLPNFPVDREIIRGDPFYEYTSPHEKTKSEIPLVIVHIKLIESRDKRAVMGKPLIVGSSPSYDTPGLPLREITVLDLSEHKVAMRHR
jgi:hypothetical protein